MMPFYCVYLGSAHKLPNTIRSACPYSCGTSMPTSAATCLNSSIDRGPRSNTFTSAAFSSPAQS